MASISIASFSNSVLQVQTCAGLFSAHVRCSELWCSHIVIIILLMVTVVVLSIIFHA